MLGYSVQEKGDDVVRLPTALEHHLRRRQRIERRLEVVDVRQHEVLAREVHQPAVVPDQAVFVALLRQALAHLVRCPGSRRSSRS